MFFEAPCCAALSPRLRLCRRAVEVYSLAYTPIYPASDTQADDLDSLHCINCCCLHMHPCGSHGEPRFAVLSAHDRSGQHRRPALTEPSVARLLPDVRQMGRAAARRNDRCRPGIAPAAVHGALPMVRHCWPVAGAPSSADARRVGRLDRAGRVDPARAIVRSVHGRCAGGMPGSACAAPARSCAAWRHKYLPRSRNFARLAP